MRKITQFALSALAFSFLLAGCDKTKPYDVEVPESQVHFVGSRNQQYNVANPPTPYNITVGTTDVSSSDREVTFKITSPSGAVAGTDYTVGVTGNKVTIPAGQATATIPVTASFTSYNAGQKDTLIFSLEEPSLKVAGFQDTIRLILRGPCFDGVDINEAANMNAQLGNYANSNDAGFGAWGPYLTKINSITNLTPTTARAVINNVWDAGFGNVNFVINWSNPANVTIDVEQPTLTSSNAGVLNAAYNGMFLVIRKHPDANGSFSVCTGEHTLRYQLGVFNPATNTLLGYFPNIGITTIER